MEKIKKIKMIIILWNIRRLTKKVVKIKKKIEVYSTEIYQQYAEKMIDKI